jgi:hypothetical protein
MEKNENPDAERSARLFFERLEKEKIGCEIFIGS